MGFSNRTQPYPLAAKAFGVITNLYTTLGTPITVPLEFFQFANSMNTGAFISLDGVTDNLYLPAGSQSLPYPPIALRRAQPQNPGFAVGTQLYVKFETAPASGQVTASSCYVPSV